MTAGMPASGVVNGFPGAGKDWGNGLSQETVLMIVPGASIGVRALLLYFTGTLNPKP